MPNQWTYAVDLVGPTDEQAEIMCKVSASGKSMTAAAAAAELPFRTVQSWVRRGWEAIERVERGEELETESEHKLASFAWEFSKARAKGGDVLEDRMTDRAEKDSGTWMEAFRKLERLHQHEWADATRQPAQQGGIQINIVGMLPERVVHVEGELVADDDGHEASGIGGRPSLRALPEVSGDPTSPGRSG